MTFQSPVIQYIVATSRIRDLQRDAERERRVREARAARAPRTTAASRVLIGAPKPAEASAR